MLSAGWPSRVLHIFFGIKFWIYAIIFGKVINTLLLSCPVDWEGVHWEDTRHILPTHLSFDTLFSQTLASSPLNVFSSVYVNIWTPWTSLAWYFLTSVSTRLHARWFSAYLRHTYSLFFIDPSDSFNLRLLSTSILSHLIAPGSIMTDQVIPIFRLPGEVRRWRDSSEAWVSMSNSLMIFI